MKTNVWLAVTLGLYPFCLDAQDSPANADDSNPAEGVRRAVVVETGPDQRVWRVEDAQSSGQIVEIGTGMNFWDGQSWTPSDPSFEVEGDAFVANRLQYKVRLRANLNQLPPTSAAHKRYLEKFDKQETQIEQLQASIQQKQEEEKKQQQEYEDYLTNLTVE